MKLSLAGALSVFATSLCAPVHAQTVVAYIDGQVALAGKPLAQTSNAETRLLPGQMFATGKGTAGLALTPGAELQLAEESAVRLIAQDARRTEIAIVAGRGEIRLNGMREGGELQVDTAGGVQTLLLQNGLYVFDAKTGQLRVFEGKAAVASSAASGWIDVKAGRLLALNNGASVPAEFDRDAGDGFIPRDEGDRASYGGGGYGEGPYAGGYGFAPYGYSAFGYPAFGYSGFGYPGYGFYSPFALGFYPGFYGGYGYGGFGRGFGGGGFGGGRFRR